MHESKGREATAQEEDKNLDDRNSEATNDETLREIEESETSSRGRPRDSGPSPDGTLDEPDEIKDAGPM
ncbi:MAG TPA: hypothetical protein VJM12_17745 [Pyrinomonadaceae bacterium]|nr:hypothetical protein [Pyrinomonadaceae bacterium]